MELTYAELSVTGRSRERNEDAVGFWQSPARQDGGPVPGAVAVLADGVGSMERADEASRIAVETSLKTFRDCLHSGTARQLVHEICRAANWAVYAAGLPEPAPRRMAATLAVAVLYQDEVVVANVGDSRAYHVRAGQARQLSVDHSYVGVQRQFGLLTEEEARTSNDRHVLTRSLGQDAEVAIDLASAPVAVADCVVLCSDGLHGAVNDRELGEIVGHATPQESCRRLVALAQHRGADDDISVQVIQVTALDDPTPSPVNPGLPTDRCGAITPDAHLGRTLDNRFLLTDVLARSGMATIFRAVDLNDNATVAVKIPFAAHRDHLQHEADVLRQLAHGYILRCVTASTEPQRAYLVTEYLRGYTLAHLLRNICPLPEDEARKIASRLCEALEHMHQRGYVHRDIKPQNVMICHDDTLRLMDFGLATRIETRASFLRRFGPTAGTPDYMAPEQVQGRAWDARTDIYGLGAMLYEMMTGAAPFAGDSAKAVMQARLHTDPAPLRSQNPHLSLALEQVILRALARDPADRYPSAAALKTDLDDPRRSENRT